MSRHRIQLPLALATRADRRFGDFVGAAARILADGIDAGDQRAWLLTGPAGVGKTHLLMATHAAHPQGSAYLALPQVAGSLADVAPMFEQHRLLALDGLEALIGHRDDEVALFDLHNRVLDHGGQLLYAARSPPEQLAFALPDLRSRLTQATRLPLSPLDETQRSELLRARAAQRGLVLDDAAAEWLMRRCERDLGSLMDVLDRLDHASLAAQRRLTVPFLREVLGSRDDG
ncbi:DnaA regulatory inactivator Hda [Solilutibacter silvestris]|uniref:DnaA regulatory inactivator Hda n=1 Tax=Solilutibacter silvestris TaxID=1645665 RepID=A0A2K1Q361_9GAMM|nr:DnaA regulatory inactivator Hda [Lysobacter silvestris]PNS09387.1 DnaA regulatory inactivator Hda [Lysobacter silvestris]